MKKISLVLLSALVATPAFAIDYDDEYDGYYGDEQYAEPSFTKSASEKRDTYAGIRIHRNEHISFKYNVNNGDEATIRSDNFGLGLTLGNRLTDNVKIELETLYTGASENKHATNFDYDIWSNMLNIYIYKNFGGAVEPYFGIGVGISGIWADIGTNGAFAGTHDSGFEMSFAAMCGINFALNKYVDLNLGARYIDYGETDFDNATAHVRATELYIGAAYKFGIFD